MEPAKHLSNAAPRTRRAFLCQSLGVAGGLSAASISRAAPNENTYDVVIYGGTPAAVTAAVQVKRMGQSVAIVCPDAHIGGLTISGLGWTDSKNGAAIGGLAREFYHRIWQFYQNPDAWTQQTRDSYIAQKVGAQPGIALDDTKQVMWTFEPHAALHVMENWLNEEKIPVFKNEWLDRGKNGVIKQGAKITAMRTLSGKVFKAKVFIDAGYEGDLMASAKIPHRVGRDAAIDWSEPLNGVRFTIAGVDRYHSADAYQGVDPYLIPGKPESGFIAGVEGKWDEAQTPLGAADTKRLQSFNYRLCLTTEAKNRAAFPKPKNYDEKQYELLFRLLATGKESSWTTQAMPNLKTDSNNQGSMSGDFVGGSFSLPEHLTYSSATYGRRKQMLADHRTYQQGLLWSLQNHERVPSELRTRLAPWGLAKDEFADNENWPYQVYVREARRMEGITTVTQHHVQKRPGFSVQDSVGLGSYSLDSHVVRRVVIDGGIRDEGGFYVFWDKPYPIPYGCLVPKSDDCLNLLVPVTVSATHAAFGSIRMEPTYMILGQAAGAAACLAIKQNVSVQTVPYADLAKQLAQDKQVLAWAADNK